MSSNLLADFLGHGNLASRPTTPSLPAGMIGIWWSDDQPAGSQLSVWNGSTWTTQSGGYSKGTPPSLVQFGNKQGSGCNTVTMPGAPANGNLLVAHCYNPLSQTAATGWTQVATNSTGTDFGTIFTKVAGAGESTSQTPCTLNPSVGATVIWELHHGSGTPVFVGGASQSEQTGSVGVLIAFGLISSAIGLASTSLVTGQTISAAKNIGTQDVLDNSADRRIAAGHIDLSVSPNAGLLCSFSGSGSSKSATCIVSAP